MLVFIMFSQNRCTGDRGGSVENEKLHFISNPSFQQLKFKTNQSAGIED